MATKRLIAVDFETEGIEDRPDYPPKPVGVAIQEKGRARYLGFGHPTGNNATVDTARNDLASFWDDPDVELVFHNSKFDVDVAETHLKLRRPKADRYHDTLFLLFLEDPHADSLSLKPSAHRLLGMAPEEQDDVRDWLLEHRPVKGITKSNWGKYICQAPGDLVGKYARGDVDRTLKLFGKLHPSIVKRKMLEAYERELELMPILLRNERRGILVDLPRLAHDVVTYERALQAADVWCRRKLRDHDVNLDSDEELAEALERGEFVDPKAWSRTKTGQRKTGIKELRKIVNHPPLLQVLSYRSKLTTFLNTFMKPWLKMAVHNGGHIHTSWNQVRGQDSGGARTGRMQSSPNFQNIPKDPLPVIYGKDPLPAGLQEHEVFRLPGDLRLPQLPMPRSYIIAEEGHVLCNRDYSQQELRILGHFEDGVLLQAFKDDPQLDVHALAQKMINSMLNKNFGRRPIKNTGFGLLYGMGLDLLADSTGTDRNTARQLKNAYLSIFPGLKDVDDALKSRAGQCKPIRTWGGREYYCEEPKYVEKYDRTMTFEYKLLNYLIQGSASDCTKQAIINYERARSPASELVLSVHDEIMIEAKIGHEKKEMKTLRDAMAAVKFDVPMLSDGRVGASWTTLKDLPLGE